MNKLLLTGGTGRLGQELIASLPALHAPSRSDLDVTCPEKIANALDEFSPQTILHAAAFTNVAAAEQQRERCWCVNVEGTRNIVSACADRGIFLIHISTDYVFEGTRGWYCESDPVGPVRNYYALSKLVSEEIVRTSPRHLIIRTSFRPRDWPYQTAFTDVYTSQDYVDVIAPKIALAVRHYRQIRCSVLHIATERKTVYELARRRCRDVQPASKREAQVALPDDCSLDISRWEEIEARLHNATQLP